MYCSQPGSEACACRKYIIGRNKDLGTSPIYSCLSRVGCVDSENGGMRTR